MLTNIDLLNIAEYYKLPIIDITMKDELPRKVVNGGYIINLQSSTVGMGTHWCCLFIDKKEAVYMDSFGMLPPVEVEAFIKKRKGVHLYYNHWEIQDIKSDACGWYCIACLDYINKHLQHNDLYHSFNTFINGFSTNTLENESILHSYYISAVGEGKPPPKLLRFIKSHRNI